MNWSPEQRRQFLDRLDSSDRLLSGFYRRLMGFLIVGILVGSAWVFLWRPLGPGHQGEYFYFGVGALLLLCCVLNQYIWARRRQRRKSLPYVAVETKTAESGRGWEFRLGPAERELASAEPTRAEFSHTFSIPLASIASDLLPDEQALACLESELARGVDLDAACRTVQPAYESWGVLKRRAYQMYVKSLLDERRRG
jgi:hypothetical protein